MITLTALALLHSVEAADHGEAPGTESDPAADLTDLYAWKTASGSVVAAITFGPLGEPGAPAAYTSGVLYGLHIDTDGDNQADVDIYARFGQAIDGSWGVLVEGIPGASGAISGAVETTLEDGAIKVWAGLREDPFFFDAEGFEDTLATGAVAFTGADFYEGFNVTAIVLEWEASALSADVPVQLWATTARK